MATTGAARTKVAGSGEWRSGVVTPTSATPYNGDPILTEGCRFVVVTLEVLTFDGIVGTFYCQWNTKRDATGTWDITGTHFQTTANGVGNCAVVTMAGIGGSQGYTAANIGSFISMRLPVTGPACRVRAALFGGAGGTTVQIAAFTR